MPPSPGGLLSGPAYTIYRHMLHQSKSKLLNQSINRSSQPIKHANFNLRKRVQRLVKTAWEGVVKPIPSSARIASRGSTSLSSSFPQTATRSNTHDPRSLLSLYAQTISQTFTRSLPSFPKGPFLSSHLGLHSNPVQSFAYARSPLTSTFGTNAASRARAAQASKRFGGGYGYAGGGGGQGRNYSTGKVMQELGNVPIGMRALAEKLREGDEKKRRMGVTGVRVGGGRKPYEKVEKRSVGGKRGSRMKMEKFGSSSTSGMTEEKETVIRSFDRYFPKKTSTPTTTTTCSGAQVVAQPEDVNTDTFFLIPLSPSLIDIMYTQPTSTQLINPSGPTAPFLPSSSSSSYHHDLSPIPRLPNLLTNLFDIHSIYSTHSRHLVYPLLNRLAGKGVFDPEFFVENREVEVQVDVVFETDGQGERRPDCLRIRFGGMGEGGVRDLIGGDALMRMIEGSEQWYHVYSIPRRAASTSTGTETKEEEGKQCLTLEENIWRMPIIDVLEHDQGDLIGDDADSAGWQSQSRSLRSSTISSPSSPSTSQESDREYRLGSLSSSSAVSSIDLEDLDQEDELSISSFTFSDPSDLNPEMGMDLEVEGWTDAEMEFGSGSETDEDGDMMVSGSALGMGMEESRVWSGARQEGRIVGALEEEEGMMARSGGSGDATGGPRIYLR